MHRSGDLQGELSGSFRDRKGLWECRYVGANICSEIPKHRNIYVRVANAMGVLLALFRVNKSVISHKRGGALCTVIKR